MTQESKDVCPWCGNKHPGKCALVKSIHYRRDGTICRVDFHSPVDMQLAVSNVFGPYPSHWDETKN